MIKSGAKQYLNLPFRQEIQTEKVLSLIYIYEHAVSQSSSPCSTASNTMLISYNTDPAADIDTPCPMKKAR